MTTPMKTQSLNSAPLPHHGHCAHRAHHLQPAMRILALAIMAIAGMGLSEVNAASTQGNHAAPAPSVSASHWRAPGGNSNAGGTHNSNGHGYYRHGYYPGRYYNQGWYRPYGWGWGGYYSGLTLGLTVPFLPFGYSSFWVGGAPYYYADDVYYTSVPGRGYRVVAPPDEYIVSDPGPTPVVAAPPVSESTNNANTPTPSYVNQATPAPQQAPGQSQLYAYPKNGQTAVQSTFDRIECERWGSGQTGYNPGQSAENMQRRNDYQRAVSACLEGRGYTVK